MARKFPQRAIELIYDFYGIVWAETLAKRIERETGMRFPARSIIAKAHTLGLRQRDAQGYLSIADASRELGIPHRTLDKHLRRYGFQLLGRGTMRFVNDEQMAKLREFYAPADATQPSMPIKDACAAIGYSREGALGLIQKGRLRAFKVGAFWRVPVAEVDRILTEQRRTA